jgi:16S rRNA (cytidine1402-2'-O)-methyltransferase
VTAPPAVAPGTLYCVPTPIASDREPRQDLAPGTLERVAVVDYVIAEHAKSARAFLKRVPTIHPLQRIEIVELNEHTRDDAIGPMLGPLLAGRDAALVSEAGCPGVADPGARLVLAAHRAGVPVVPMIGPSALLLALMGSGLNGQRFAFAGYLPTAADERRHRIVELEQRSRREDETQLFIETPYRNQAMLDALLSTLAPDTSLCIAVDLTGSRQSLMTERVERWRARPPRLERLPTVFLLLARR